MRSPASGSVATTSPLRTISRRSIGTIERSETRASSAWRPVASASSSPGSLQGPLEPRGRSASSTSGPFVAMLRPALSPARKRSKSSGPPVFTNTRLRPTGPRSEA